MSRRVRATAALCGAFLLAACANDAPDADPAQRAGQAVPPRFEVQSRTDRLTLPLVPGAGGLSLTARSALQRFVATEGDPQALHIRVEGSVAFATATELRRALTASGVEPSKISFVEAAPAGAPVALAPGGIRVVATRYAAVPADCPHLSRVRIAGPDNPTSSNWGCSSRLALETMVADPRDLVRGETGGTTDSEITSGAIDRLRHDKLKPYIGAGSTLTIGSGS